MRIFKKPKPASAAGPTKPEVGAMMMERGTNRLLIFDGNSWQAVNEESWEERVNRLAAEYPAVAAAKRELELQMALVYGDQEQ